MNIKKYLKNALITNTDPLLEFRFKVTEQAILENNSYNTNTKKDLLELLSWSEENSRFINKGIANNLQSRTLNEKGKLLKAKLKEQTDKLATDSSHTISEFED